MTGENFKEHKVFEKLNQALSVKNANEYFGIETGGSLHLTNKPLSVSQPAIPYKTSRKTIR